jgi:nitrite reductase/ring-hydroxylating ferredoxin subunit
LPELEAHMSNPADLDPTSSPDPAQSEVDRCPRRTLLRAAGLAALIGAGGAAFAGCTASGSTAPSASSAPQSSAESSAAPQSASASSRSTSAAAPSGPSVAKADVPEGGGVILQSADYVVTEPKPGVYKGFSSTCTHMGFKVGKVENGAIKCLHHGSSFSITDGSVLTGPASTPLPSVNVTVSGGRIVVSG